MKTIFLLLASLILVGCSNILQQEENTDFINPYLEYTLPIQDNLFKQIKSSIDKFGYKSKKTI